MTVRRTLTLKSERLGELSDTQLRGVRGAQASKFCPSNLVTHCEPPSEPFATLCGCLTDLCGTEYC